MTPILGILIGLLGGALIAGGIFLVLAFLKYAREMKSSLDQLRIVLLSLSKDNTLAESMNSFREMVETGKRLIVRVDKLHTVIDAFFKVAVKAEAMAAVQAAAPAAEGASEVYPYDEERAAAAEVQRRLRTAGVQIPADAEIPSDKATGAQV
jgi:hypothetical protein